MTLGRNRNAPAATGAHGDITMASKRKSIANAARRPPPTRSRAKGSTTSTEPGGSPGAVTQVTEVTQPSATVRTPETSSARQSRQLVELADGATLLHSIEGEAWATFAVGQHRENWSIRSGEFGLWLRRAYFERHKSVPNTEALEHALSLLEARALFEGKTVSVFTRIGEYSDRIYLDLADEEWRVIEIDANGWRLAERVPVIFRRTRGMKPLPMPVAGGTTDEFRRFFNLSADEDFTLLLAVLASWVRPRGPYPILEVTGEAGSAKTTLARFARELIDPQKTGLRSSPRDERDLMIAAKNSWVLGFDNLSGLSPVASDLLCRIATGGGYSTRRLYSDSEETIFDVERPIIVNGIDEVIGRSDLIDRAVALHLPTIPTDKRRTREELEAAFLEARPRMLGLLLDGVSCALRRLQEVHLERLPRMADFAKWATAAEPGLGLPTGSVIRALNNNRRAADERMVAASPIVGPLEALLANGPWSGNAQTLLVELQTRAGDSTEGLPRNARLLSIQLRRIMPNLRSRGYKIEFIPHGRVIRLWPPRSAETSVTSVTSVTGLGEAA
jgi:hypothetical protein